MIYHDCAQGSEEWEQLRLGIPTASCFDKIITPAKLELSKSARGYLCTLLAEWAYGAPVEAYASPWMERGQALEAEAVEYYEMDRDVTATRVGFVSTDDGMAGASPDRLVGDDGLLEQKCPSPAVHFGYMLEPQSLLNEYRLQHQGQLWITGRAWCDVQSYCPPFPSVIVRAVRDQRVIDAIARHVPAFIATMLKARAALTATYGDLRCERIMAAAAIEQSRASFDKFMDSEVGGVV